MELVGNLMGNSLVFSVIIPLYNKADTVGRTLRSVQAQTYRDFEVVVVDDGSTDNGLLEVEKFRDLFPLKVVRQQNAGVSVARNTGAQHSSAPYLAFLDADDEWLPGYLDEIMSMMRKWPNIEVYGTNYYYMLERCVVSNRVWGRTQRLIDFQKAWITRCPIHTSSSVVKKSAFHAVGGFERGHSYYEDAELLFKLSRRGMFCVSQLPLLKYNTDAIVRATGSDKPFSAYAHWSYIEATFASGGICNGLERVARAEVERRLIENFLHNRLNCSFQIKAGFPHMFNTVGRVGDMLLDRQKFSSWFIAVCIKIKYFVVARLAIRRQSI